MIVNTSTLHEQDLCALAEAAAHDGISSKRGKRRGIILLVFFALMICYSVTGITVLVFARTVWHLPPAGNGVSAIIMYAVYALVSALCIYLIHTKKRRYVMVWLSMHSQRFRSLLGKTTTAVFGADGVLIRHNENEKQPETRYTPELFSGYSVRENALDISLMTAEGQRKVLVLHDDCYTEGTKAELLALLEQWGIKLSETEKG